ncbi:hypothetical protein Tcan_12427, partial [Toxocara canis]
RLQTTIRFANSTTHTQTVLPSNDASRVGVTHGRRTLVSRLRQDGQSGSADQELFLLWSFIGYRFHRALHSLYCTITAQDYRVVKRCLTGMRGRCLKRSLPNSRFWLPDCP